MRWQAERMEEKTELADQCDAATPRTADEIQVEDPEIEPHKMRGSGSAIRGDEDRRGSQLPLKRIRNVLGKSTSELLLIVAVALCCGRAGAQTTWTAQTSGVLTQLRSVAFTGATHAVAVGASGTITATIDGGNMTATGGTTEALYDIAFPTATVEYIRGFGGNIKTEEHEASTKQIGRAQRDPQATGQMRWGAAKKQSEPATAAQASATVAKRQAKGEKPEGTCTAVATKDLHDSPRDKTMRVEHNKAEHHQTRHAAKTDLEGAETRSQDRDTQPRPVSRAPRQSIKKERSSYVHGMPGPSAALLVLGAAGVHRRSAVRARKLVLMLVAAFCCDGAWAQAPPPAPPASPTDWAQQTSPVTSALYAVAFPTVDVGYIVGDAGMILKTSDGGATWTTQTSGVTGILYAVAFPTVDVGYAVGVEGEILKTSDGGATWTAQTSGVTSNLLAVAFPTVDVGYAVGASGEILKTSDGGATWTVQTSGVTGDLWAVAFPTTVDVGYAVGASGEILKTSDGGATWTAQTSGVTDILYAVAFPTVDVGYAVGYPGVILKTIDGGATWTAQTSGVTSIFFGVAFPTVDVGYAVGDSGVIHKTIDGGTAWTEQTVPATVTSYLRAVAFPTVDVGYAVGASGVILTHLSPTDAPTTGPPPTADAPGPAPSQLDPPYLAPQIIPASFRSTDWTAVAFPNTNDGVIVGKSGAILATSNGGAIWAAQTLPPGAAATDLQGVSFPSSAVGFAVGDSGVILATIDGGRSWMVQPVPSSAASTTLWGVSFLNAAVGLAVGSAGTILATIDGGSSWIAQTVPDGAEAIDLYGVALVSAPSRRSATETETSWTAQTSEVTTRLNSVAFISATHAVAVGNSGMIMATIDGGSTWTEQTSPVNTGDLNSVAFPTATVGYAVGHNGVILGTSDGGDTWTQQPSTVGNNLRRVAFTSATNGVIVGHSGRILLTSDGGNTWTQPPSPAGNTHLYGVAFTSAADGVIVGKDGTILTTSNGGSTWTQQPSSPAGNTDLNSVAFTTSATDGVIVGNSGKVLATSNGGSTWTEQDSGVPNDLKSVAFTSATNGVIVGTNGLILATSDGGSSWTEQTSPDGTSGLWGVACEDTNCLAVGAGGTILGYLPPTDAPTTAPASASYVGVVVGESGTILVTADGGASWIRKLVPSSAESTPLFGVSFVNATTAIVVGANGTILAMEHHANATDGGVRTVTLGFVGGPTESILDLRGVAFASATDGVIVGKGGMVLWSADGGSSWERKYYVKRRTVYAMPSREDLHLQAVAFPNASVAIVAGVSGMVLGPGPAPPAPKPPAADEDYASDASLPKGGFVALVGTLLLFGMNPAPVGAGGFQGEIGGRRGRRAHYD